MKYVVTDASGNILRTVNCNDEPTAKLQVPSGGMLFQIPDDTGLVDDGQLTVSAGALVGSSSAPGYGTVLAPIALP